MNISADQFYVEKILLGIKEYWKNKRTINNE